MSEFKIKSQNVRSLAQDLNNIARQMQGLEDQIRRIQNGLSFEIAQKERIRQRLRTAQNNTASHSRKIYNSTSTLQNVVNTCETTELRLAGKRVPMAEIVKTTAMSAASGVMTIGPGSLNTGQIDPFSLPGTPGGLLPKLMDASSWSYYEKTEIKNNYGKYENEFDDSKIEENKISFASKNKDELEKSKIEAAKIWELSAKKTESVFHNGNTFGKEDSTHFTYNADVLKREAAAELYAGLYYIDPESKQKKLRLAAGVSLGVSVSAFSADFERYIGGKYFGHYVKGDVAFGKAEVKGEAVIGLKDAKGNINPTVHGKLSAEAIAAEASLTKEVKFAGADVGVKGSINVGIGAHAEVGVKDWKISFDVGASFGIGGSVKLEVDLSGTVKAASGLAKSAWEGFKRWFK